MLTLALGLLPLIASIPTPNDDESHIATSNFQPDDSSWSNGASFQYMIKDDNSCNTTQLSLIGEGLDRTIDLVYHARDHIRRYGSDDVFKRWFGVNASSNAIEGLFDRIIDGDKDNITFTCNDYDGLCNGKYGIIPGYFSPATPQWIKPCRLRVGKRLCVQLIS